LQIQYGITRQKMNLYEHTIIAKQSHSTSQLENLKTKYSKLNTSQKETKLFEEYKKGLLGKKAESVRRVMEKDNYKRLAKSLQLRGRAGRAFKNFNHLITDPRQQHFFKLKNFNIKGLTEDLLKKIK